MSNIEHYKIILLNYACFLMDFHRFSIFMWTGENDSKTLREDAYIFGNWGRIFIRQNFMQQVT